MRPVTARRGGAAAVLPVALVAAAAVAALLATRDPGGGGAATVRPLSVPILSVRRAPDTLATFVADSRLGVELAAIMSRPSWGLARERSCLMVQQDDRTLFELRPADALVPASNLKLVTALAALEELGAASTLTTEVRAAAPVAGGVVDGALYLVGGGDPLLATADYAATLPNHPQPVTALERLADAVRDAGVREVRGGVVGDETRYDTQRYHPAWRASYISDHEAGPQSALTVNDGFAVYTGGTKRAAVAPAANAAAVFTSLLRARGIVVGEPGEGRAPDGAAVVAALPSLPMSEIVAQMLRESDNLTAELLLKELGRRRAGDGATTAGVSVVRSVLEREGLADDDLDAVDGSGLARSDKATCRLLLGTLVDDDSRAVIEAGLPVAARSGTLAKRFSGHPGAGLVRAKTGSLDHITGLSGWATPTRGSDLAFALLANDLPDRMASGRALQEAVSAALVAYPDAPEPGRLGVGP